MIASATMSATIAMKTTASRSDMGQRPKRKKREFSDFSLHVELAAQDAAVLEPGNGLG